VSARLATAGGGLALYALTLALELPAAALRWLVFGTLALIVLGLAPGVSAEPGASAIALTAALAPLAWSALALLGLPAGAGVTRFAEGARRPSARERARVEGALAELPGGVRGPRRWYVLDDPTPGAFVVGQVLYLHRGLVSDPALPAVLAHELGHLRTLDARISLAASRLVVREAKTVGGRLLFGGASFWLLEPLWLLWMRRGELLADAYAARLGQADALADYLERHLFFDVAVPYMRGRTHPYTELRLDRLRRSAAEAVADAATTTTTRSEFS
jgi:Zn-dependent protease with chaperone function